MKRIQWVFLLCGLTVSSQAQHQPGRSEGFRSQTPIIFEAIPLPGDSGKQRIDVHFRIPERLFVLVRNDEPDAKGEYLARGEVAVELLDKESVSFARALQKVTITSPTSNPEPGSMETYQGMMTFSVPSGEYTILMEVDDLESGRRVLDRNRRVSTFGLKKSESKPVPLFVNPIIEDTSGRFVTPQNFGGNPLFGKPGALLLALPNTLSPERITSITYAIRSDDEEDRFTLEDTVSNPVIFEKTTLQPIETQKSIRYQIVPSTESSMLEVPIPLERLPLRSFSLSLQIRSGKETEEITKKFVTLWPDMPRSLRDVEYALEMLNYITRPSQLDSLRSGSYEEQRRNLETFWRGKDPRKDTPINGAMAEYYRRVDYATQHYSSLRDNDGAKTDRGRIYILHGPPTKIERTLNPTSGYKEEWSYSSSGKVFLFVDENKSGRYTLVSSRTI